MNQFLARSVLDWRWFFHAAKAEMGISSSWEPLAFIARCGGPSRSLKANGDKGEDRRLAASRKHARIERALCLVEPQSLILIRLACEEQTHTLRLAFGELGNVAHLTEAAYRAKQASGSTRPLNGWLDRLAFKHARGRASPAGLNAIRDIRLGCEDVLGPAREDYVRALGRI